MHVQCLMGTTVLHISDLHFGHEDPSVTEPLIQFARRLRPDAVVVSGDLTQRARDDQFEAARLFLQELPVPQLVVPGNHDVPLYDIFARFSHPFEKYEAYITEDLAPVLRLPGVTIFGICTARSLTISGGALKPHRLAQLRERVAREAGRGMKILVSHHPINTLKTPELWNLGFDVLLAGHLHVGSAGLGAERGIGDDEHAVLVQAGTATSTRHRGEVNSFNVIRLEKESVEVVRYQWDERREIFVPLVAKHFTKPNGGWRLTPESPEPRVDSARPGLVSRAPRHPPASSTAKPGV